MYSLNLLYIFLWFIYFV
uniref:Uncharacterized protein n=1 Tax=Arundo donax TaxID=35708 RepID=A0A0A9C808_ARUDO